MSQKRKIALVTGGAGFIGSHLCERLIAMGEYMVISLDNYFTGKEENHIQGVTYIKGHTKDIERLILEKPNIIYHLGEYSRVEKSFDDMDLILSSNILGTSSVVEFALKCKAKLVYAGSSTKFSNDGEGRNQSPYAWSKATNTELVKNYGAWFGLPFAITYFYNVYGPREIKEGPYATLIGIFSSREKKGEPLSVVAPGTQKRNFTHVSDIVDGLILIGENGEGDGFGLGAEESYSVLEVAKMFGGEITILPERRGNRMDSPLDTSKASLLGWKTTHSLKDFIDQVLKGQI